jgi:hypothetical protein
MNVPLTLSDLNILLVGASIDSVSFTSSSIDISLINEDPTATSISTARIEIFCKMEILFEGNLKPVQIPYGPPAKNANHLISEIGKKIQFIETDLDGFIIYVNDGVRINIKLQDSATESINFYCTVNGKNRTLYL